MWPPGGAAGDAGALTQDQRGVAAVFKERRMPWLILSWSSACFKSPDSGRQEVSPDTRRFWDQTTKESMDKDRFRKDLGKIEEAYQEVLKGVWMSRFRSSS